MRVDIKPLSVNKAWKGKRYKTDEYNEYEQTLLFILPNITLPQPPYEVYYKFGFSSLSSDWDNPIKPMQDVLSKKYGFNDKLIKRAVIETEVVKKGNEYFEFEIKEYIK